MPFQPLHPFVVIRTLSRPNDQPDKFKCGVSGYEYNVRSVMGRIPRLARLRQTKSSLTPLLVFTIFTGPAVATASVGPARGRWVYMPGMAVRYTHPPAYALGLLAPPKG